VFFILGTIFSHAYVRPVWFKCSVVVLPFISLTLDISSWYFTKLYSPFAWVVILSGGVMAMAFTYMWAVSMYQMWFSSTPIVVTRRQGGGTPPMG